MTPEARARHIIYALLAAAIWYVCDIAEAKDDAVKGVATREYPLNPGHSFTDYFGYATAIAFGVTLLKLHERQ
ncbi:hypothetical protein LPB72_07320 [Hydrogenophaga crassostreae]|uniref:Uncharacterized protein n=1 Tax=Hydrogenophaga crassostreae TaxID=1763535 RepID=A0A162Z0R6_9BURK|nr:hypothetical protein [Hydrogenophaga crassostreae]AOW13144.1 hypothetical protein LPB072_10050 [Hydrogenophaga crassostreae]OAD42711.1 hypothetical protein LPB72_07320 [Hydrogenophaga crassostreae]